MCSSKSSSTASAKNNTQWLSVADDGIDNNNWRVFVATDLRVVWIPTTTSIFRNIATVDGNIPAVIIADKKYCASVLNYLVVLDSGSAQVESHGIAIVVNSPATAPARTIILWGIATIADGAIV